MIILKLKEGSCHFDENFGGHSFHIKVSVLFVPEKEEKKTDTQPAWSGISSA